MTFRSDGKATLRSPLPDEVAFESLASRLRPFTVDTDDLFYGKAFDALDRLLAAPEHDKFRRISQAVHQDWRTATDRTSRTRAYRISSEAAQHTDVDLAFSWLHGDLVLRASRGCSVISVVTCGVTRRDQLIRLARSTPHSKGVQVIVVGRVSVRDGCGHQRDRQQSAEHAHGYLHCRSPIVLELQPTTNASHLTCFSVVSWRKGPPHSVVLGARRIGLNGFIRPRHRAHQKVVVAQRLHAKCSAHAEDRQAGRDTAVPRRDQESQPSR